MTRYDWRKYLDELFPGKETITVMQLATVLGKGDQKSVEKGIRECMFPGKAIFNMNDGRYRYVIHKWAVAAWLAEQGRVVVGV